LPHTDRGGETASATSCDGAALLLSACPFANEDADCILCLCSLRVDCFVGGLCGRVVCVCVLVCSCVRVTATALLMVDGYRKE
jgi:hypothetical protein